MEHLEPLAIGPWEVRVATNSLIGNGTEVQVEPRLMKLLVYLAKRPGQVVSKEAIVQDVWREQFVATEAISVAIYELRKALGDNAKNPKYIKTIRKAGFQWIGPVAPFVAPEAEQISPKRNRWHHTKARLLVAGFLFVSLMVVVVWLAKMEPKASPTTPSVAILPFEYMSEDREQAYFAAGMTEAIVNDLALNTEVRVLPRRSVLRFADSSLDARTMGRQLGVAYCVEGSVQSVSNQVMVTVQIVEVATERHLWAKRYQKEIRDFFAIQKEASRDLIGFFSGTPSESPSLESLAPETYHSYLKGRYFLNKNTSVGARKAIAYFSLVVKKAPDFAPAFAGLAKSYAFFGPFLSVPEGQARRLALENGQKAIRLDDRIAEAHLVMGYIQFVHQWRWEPAEQAFIKARELHPNDTVSTKWHGLFQAARGQLEPALETLSQAHKLDPVDVEVMAALGYTHLLLNRHDLAVQFLEKAVELEPDHLETQVWLFLARHHDLAETPMRAAFQSWRSGFAQGSPVASYLLGEEPFSSTDIMRRPGEMTDLWAPVPLAVLCRSIGAHEAAAQWLKAAWETRDHNLVFVRINPMLAFLRDHPEYRDQFNLLKPGF